MASYLTYWRPGTARRELDRGGLVEHAGSTQFSRVEEGDVLWIVTAWSGGSLSLLSRLVVGTITDQRTAEEFFGTSNIWQAPHHVIAAKGTAEPIREISLTDIVEQLRFESEKDRLIVEHGRVDAKQL